MRLTPAIDAARSVLGPDDVLPRAARDTATVPVGMTSGGRPVRPRRDRDHLLARGMGRAGETVRRTFAMSMDDAPIRSEPVESMSLNRLYFL